MFQVDRGTLDALVANRGAIKADGGRIYLTADALDALAKATVNNTGLIEALSVDNRHGVVELLGEGVSNVKVGDRVVGGIVVYRLLAHKPALDAADIELLELLGTHAATALYCSELTSRSREPEGA